MREPVFALLDQLGLPYEVTEHPAVYSIEEMEQLGITAQGDVCKNLFLRDAKGKNHYLVVMLEEKHADLKKLALELDSTKLSFASAERLQKYLGVAAGSVSPFGILNDAEHQVTVALDRDMEGKTRLGVHPNDNTATVWLSYDSLVKALRSQGNPVQTIRI